MANIKHKQLPPKIFNLKGWVDIVDEEKLNNLFEQILLKAEFKILNFSSHQFPVNGYTAFWLLAESHLALHTFSDDKVTYIELSSCNYEKTTIFKELTDEIMNVVNWDQDIVCCEPALINTNH